MATSDRQLNRLERILFRVALVVAALILAVRVGSLFVIGYLHHMR